ncbi:fibroblast growth factor receptor 4-like isoform X2 [Planococcus citri]|uniref:fibroblast growth factor receptor 4-like isoform X2 n=1 Tax=Planococcus citri TaxID=170843 RepID=UPI0031F985CF
MGHSMPNWRIFARRFFDIFQNQIMCRCHQTMPNDANRTFFRFFLTELWRFKVLQDGQNGKFQLQIAPVVRALKIINGPTNESWTIGQAYRQKCDINRKEEVRIEWYHTDVQPKNDTFDKPAMHTISNVDSSELKFEITGENQKGWYTCRALAKDGGDVYKSGYLIVKPKEDGGPSILWSISGGIGLAVLLATVMLFFYHKFRENNPIPPTAMRQYLRRVVITKNLDSDSTSDEVKNRIDVRFDYYVAPENFIKEGNQCYEFQKDEDWDIPSEHVRLLDGKPLGEGNFGKVYKAEAFGVLKPGTFTTVAVKTLKEGYNEEAVKNFVLETETMKVIGNHKNIINLLAVCVDKGEMMVIMEYAARGSLLSLLRTQNHVLANEEYYAISGNNLSESTLLGFALQIAEAMEFLASRKCIHRDLAARNVLVTENYVMKVADFGLARNVHENDYYRFLSECKLPVKWMAPESLYQQKYTTQSDVWSFGITLYEIMSQGTPPYPALLATEVIKQVREGLRMDKPDLCSVQTYKLMQDCWSYRPEDRPTFTEIKERLADLISNMEQVTENFQMDSSSSESEEEQLESSLYNAPLIYSV